jgi:hypothetical protein
MWDGRSHGSGFVDLLRDYLKLIERDERTDVGIRERAVANLELGELIQAVGEEARINAAMDITALNGKAGLSGIHHGAPDRGAGSNVNVGIFEHNHGVFAAKFEGDGKQTVSGSDSDTASGGNTAGENQLINGAGDQILAGRTESGDDLERRWEGGEAFVGESHGDKAFKFESSLRSELTGLEDNGIAGGKGGKGISGWNGERVIPRGNDADDAERLPGQSAALEAQRRIFMRNVLSAEDCCGIPGAEDGGIGGNQHVIEKRFLKRLTGLSGNDTGKRFLLLAEQFRQATEHGTAADEGQLRPPELRLAGTSDSRGNIRGGGNGVVRERRTIGGVKGGETVLDTGLADDMNAGVHQGMLYSKLATI